MEWREFRQDPCRRYMMFAGTPVPPLGAAPFGRGAPARAQNRPFEFIPLDDFGFQEVDQIFFSDRLKVWKNFL